MEPVMLIYQATKKFPKEEIYGLSAQVRRAAVSIPSNIAEGQGRQTTREFLHFLSVAQGSLREAETQVIIAERLSYTDQQEATPIMDKTSEVARLLHGLVNSLRKK